MSVAPGEIKVQNMHVLIQHAAQEKVATSTHSINDIMASNQTGFNITKGQDILW